MTFQTIVADPPWKFGNTASQGAAENHYPTMADGEILALPVKDWAASDAHLYLWVTAAHLSLGLRVMDAWGFKYVQNLVWVKVSDAGKLQMGLGNYYRHAHELCLFGKRGKVPIDVHNLTTVFWAPRGRHSEKPGKFYDMVERFSPGPRLEMFARAPRAGWTVWGDEAHEKAAPSENGAALD